MTNGSSDLWVFGYGSLMWRPGFPFVESHVATIRGYHRALCIYSFVHRGTKEKPGLVLGLDRGGACRGVVFRIPREQSEATLAYLRERELVTNVYREVRVTAQLDEGRRVTCITYVADRAHEQYAGRLSEAELLRLVSQGHGISGSNLEYVRNTHQHLVELGIKDRASLKILNI